MLGCRTVSSPAGLKPSLAVRRGALVVAAAALLVGGCAQHRYAASHVTGPAKAEHVASVRKPRVQFEDDGLPVQSPPLRASLGQDDDPTEPFSPNYGSIPIDDLADDDGKNTAIADANAGRDTGSHHNRGQQPVMAGNATVPKVRVSPLSPPKRTEPGLSDSEAARLIARAKRAHGWGIW